MIHAERQWSPGGEDLSAWIRAEIRAGRLVPGQRLVEIDITGTTGAPRGTVRRALQRLEAEGVVTIEPFRGASVRRLGRDEIVHFYEVREALEGLAARLAAERGSDPAPLLNAQKASDAAARSRDAETFLAANEAWHTAIVARAGNPELCASLERLRFPTLRLLSRSFVQHETIAAAAASQHRVTGAVLSGKPDDAEAAMRAHIRDGLAAVLNALADRGA